MHVCPVCGYPSLTEPPRSPSGGGSYEICPSCGFQFGVDDDDRGQGYEDARKAWVAAGMPWSSKGIPTPKKWDAKRQLATLKSSSEPAGKVVKKTTKKSSNTAVPKKTGKTAPARPKKPVQAAKKKARGRR